MAHGWKWKRIWDPVFLGRIVLRYRIDLLRRIFSWIRTWVWTNYDAGSSSQLVCHFLRVQSGTQGGPKPPPTSITTFLHHIVTYRQRKHQALDPILLFLPLSLLLLRTYVLTLERTILDGGFWSVFWVLSGFPFFSDSTVVSNPKEIFIINSSKLSFFGRRQPTGSLWVKASIINLFSNISGTAHESSLGASIDVSVESVLRKSLRGFSCSGPRFWIQAPPFWLHM